MLSGDFSAASWGQAADRQASFDFEGRGRLRIEGGLWFMWLHDGVFNLRLHQVVRQPFVSLSGHPFRQFFRIVGEHRDGMPFPRNTDVIGVLSRGAAETFRVVQHPVAGQALGAVRREDYSFRSIGAVADKWRQDRLRHSER